MNKKVLKIVLASSAILMMASPVMTINSSSDTVQAAQVNDQKTVGMKVYKYTKNHKGHTKSMATAFVGNKAKLIVNNGKVSQMVIHVDGANSSMGKGQDVSKIVKSLRINGVSGQKKNISKDHSSFDFVFSGSAFKNNGWVKMNVTINFGGAMNEQAWVKFDKVSGLKNSNKKVVKPKKQVNHKKVSKKSNR